jgi:hypothetical protein
MTASISSLPGRIKQPNSIGYLPSVLLSLLFFHATPGPSACAGSIVSNPSPDLLLNTPASIFHPYLPASFSPLNSWVPSFRLFPSFSVDVPFVQFFNVPFPNTDFISSLYCALRQN